MNKPLLVMSTVAAFLFASCDNENTTNPEPLGAVTIKGAIVSDLNEDDDLDEPPLEKIPADVNVYVFDDNTGALLGQTKTTADGYSIEIQVGNLRDVYIQVGDFQTTINVFVGGGDFENRTAIYNDREGVTINNLVKGATYIQNIEINQPTPIDF